MNAADPPVDPVMNALGSAAAAGALATAVIGLAAPATASPSGVGNAQDTLSQLESQGYDIHVTQQGRGKPLEQASIASVRYDHDHRVVHVTTR